MNKDLDPWTKEFNEEFQRKPYYDDDEELPVEPLLIVEKAKEQKLRYAKSIDMYVPEDFF